MSRSIRDEDPRISLFDPEDSIQGDLDDEDEDAREDDYPRDATEDESVIDYSDDVEDEE